MDIHMGELYINFDLRIGYDRRDALPFGTQGPWLTKGGGLIFTNRRNSSRRTADKEFFCQSIDFDRIQNGTAVQSYIS